MVKAAFFSYFLFQAIMSAKEGSHFAELSQSWELLVWVVPKPLQLKPGT